MGYARSGQLFEYNGEFSVSNYTIVSSFTFLNEFRLLFLLINLLYSIFAENEGILGYWKFSERWAGGSPIQTGSRGDNSLPVSSVELLSSGPLNFTRAGWLDVRVSITYYVLPGEQASFSLYLLQPTPIDDTIADSSRVIDFAERPLDFCEQNSGTH